MKGILLVVFIFIFINTMHAQPLDRNIYIETIIDARVTDVWNAWTTKNGLQSFLAPECSINLNVDGTLNVFFFPDAPAGQRGAEGLRILSVQPNKMLSFTWNNPPDFPEIRNQWTHVILKFYTSGGNSDQTKLVLIHDGWGDGEIWDQVYSYFTEAWKDVVLFRLNYRFDKGPVNWSYPPQNTGKYNIIMH